MKKIITLLTISSMLAAPCVALADNSATIDNPVLIQSQDDVAPMFKSNYISNSVTVKNINDGVLETVINGEAADNYENIINYVISENTLVLSYADTNVKEADSIKVGDSITVFTNGIQPAPLIMPPQYQADVIIVQDDAESDTFNMANVDTYKRVDEYYVNAENTLAFEADENTKIVDAKGYEIDIPDFENKNLVVFYSESTKSIPALTTATKIIVLDENNADDDADVIKAKALLPTTKAIKIGDEEITNLYVKENNLMVPIRKVAESFGIIVEWDGENKAVILNNGMYSMTIGQNSYNKGKMMPVELSVAPEVTNDSTFVPVEYLTEILELDLDIKLNDEKTSVDLIEIK